MPSGDAPLHLYVTPGTTGNVIETGTSPNTPTFTVDTSGNVAAGSLNLKGALSATSLSASLSTSMAYAPTGAVQEGAVGLINATGNTQALNASGTADFYLAYFPLGRVINSITFLSGGTASTGLTHSWAAIYNVNGALIAQSPDNTTAEWLTGVIRTFSLASPLTITAATWYYVAISVTVATTMPTFIGQAISAGASKIAPASGMHFFDSTHTALGAVATPTFTAATATSGYAYWYVS